MFDNQWIQIAVADYVIDETLAQDGSNLCRIKISPTDLPFNIIGMPAFFGYYVTHSWTESGQGTMSFAPHQDSTKSKVESGQTPAKELTVHFT
mmetsp:Transcript_42828/g.56600  ORF Transcript_42828/g.56600 Transcript_42828/m.56600 type:complete len:93 (+) Transcript_42828:1119-1397(+)